MSNSTARRGGIKVLVIHGFSHGSGQIDVIDENTTNSAGTSLSTTASTGPTNTDSPAFAAAFFTTNSSAGASVSASNGFQINRLASEDTVQRSVAKLLTSNAAVDTTFTWTTSRAGASAQLVVVKSAPATSTGNMFLMF